VLVQDPAGTLLGAGGVRRTSDNDGAVALVGMEAAGTQARPD
jgi:hypothetical protein